MNESLTHEQMNDRMHHYGRVEATFQPKRTDDLKPGVAEMIGRRFIFRGCYMLDDDEGQFGGQRVWDIDPDTFPDYRYFGWLPTEDLADVIGLD